MRDELVAQIAAQPDDPGPYLVYADWLAQSADPLDRARGEWIVAATPGRYDYGSYGETGVFDGDALCDVIARSAWGAQLVYLDLTSCGLSDGGVRRLFDLPRLEMIDLSDNVLGADTLAEVRARWRLLNAE